MMKNPLPHQQDPHQVYPAKVPIRSYYPLAGYALPMQPTDQVHSTGSLQGQKINAFQISIVGIKQFPDHTFAWNYP